MKTILTGNDAIQIYETIQGAYSSENVPKACGYFISDDCEITAKIYDKHTIVAFDSTNGGPYNDGFSNINDAIEWINK